MGQRALAVVALPAVAFAAIAVAGGTAVAQQRTNRDQSGYTELHKEGFPIKAGLRIVPASEAKLTDVELVIGVVVGAEARAYPVNLMWGPESEALNDTLGGVPVVATWCPIAHSAVVYERKLRERTLDVGTLGLERGVFQLYDRQTRSQWSQVSGVASRGPQKGSALRKRESILTTWATWRRLHPDTTVYFDAVLPNHHPFDEDTIARITLAGEGPLRNEDLVAGIETPRGARAWLLRALGAGKDLNDEAAGEPVLVYLARDAVTVRVTRRRVSGRVLTFAAEEGDRLRDAETGTVWDGLTGRALSGPMSGRALEPLVVTTALWYAWSSQHPGTTLWGPETAGASPVSPVR
jgi:hypothetical protein